MTRTCTRKLRPPYLAVVTDSSSAVEHFYVVLAHDKRGRIRRKKNVTDAIRSILDLYRDHWHRRLCAKVQSALLDPAAKQTLLRLIEDAPTRGLTTSHATSQPG